MIDSSPTRVLLALFCVIFAGAVLAPVARGAEASWSFDPPSWDFGTLVPESGESLTKEFTLTNTGDVDLTPVFFAVGGNEGAGFSLAGNDCGKLIPGASCEVGVGFEPETPGAKEGELHVSSQGGEVPQASAELRGRGAGPEVSVTPKTRDFGALPLGAVSAPQTFTVANTGSLDLKLSWLSFILYINGDTDQFEITGGTCAAGTVVPPGDSCTVEAVFKPTRPGPLAADLLIDSNAGQAYAATVEGEGLAPVSTLGAFVPFTGRAQIVHRPAKRTSKRHATFRLNGSPTGYFACKLDDEKVFTRCDSPVRYRKLRPGRHRFTVRALSDFSWGPTTVYRWFVRRDS